MIVLNDENLRDKGAHTHKTFFRKTQYRKEKSRERKHAIESSAARWQFVRRAPA